MRIGVLIQARTASKRFPEKIFAILKGKPIIRHVWDACNGVAEECAVIAPWRDWKIKAECDRFRIKIWRPSEVTENDVLSRYIQAAKHFKLEGIIRVTADCPLMPRAIVQIAVDKLRETDYVSNTIVRSFPEGFDIQGCSIKALDWFDGIQDTEREHPFVQFDNNAIIRQQFLNEGFKIGHILNNANIIFTHLSIDTKEDLERLEGLEWTPNCEVAR